ncbi:hypothetical protein [Bradyrhizobium ivorense]|uniref:hypothetical protein n=1 Tax=Bradyrhizobium ivorense TaxID=2511166 RepID=UPI0010B78191|nr:hypothetical protein [Bradyrhizobium ivorense]VIO80154.1 hypothetical protein CI41S_71140 [Bradyrhizobium ivorense]
MTRRSGTAGFQGRPAPVASSRLTSAIAASLAIGALALCLVVTLTDAAVEQHHHGDAGPGVIRLSPLAP